MYLKVGKIQYLRSLFRLSQMLRFHSFLWLSNIPGCVCVCVCVLALARMPSLFYSFVYGHLGCLYIPATVNNIRRNIGVHIFLQISVLGFFGYIPKNRTAGSQGSFIFNFLRTLHIVFYGGCANLHSFQKYKRVSFPPQP